MEASGDSLVGPGRRWWTVLHRDRAWAHVLTALDRHVRQRSGADRALLWLRLPPSGGWLRWSDDPDLEMVAAPTDDPWPERTADPPLAETDGRWVDAHGFPDVWRRLFEREGLAGVWLVPLTPPAALAEEESWRAVLGLAWRTPPPARPRDLDLGVFVPGLWYLLKERMESAYTEAVVDLALGLGVPVDRAEWRERLDALRPWLGGEVWTLYRLTQAFDADSRLEVVAEVGEGEGRGHGERVAAFLQAHPEWQARSYLLTAAAQRTSTFVADFAEVYADIPNPRLKAEVRSALVLPLGEDDEGANAVLAVHWAVPSGWRQAGLSMRSWDAFRRLASEWWRTAPSLRDAVHDALTGVWNRRGLRRAWREEARAWPAGMVGVVDADYFSDVNNRWGHLVGDAVLCAVAHAARAAALRHGGFAARWGGDEFVLCLPGAVDWEAVGREMQAEVDARLRREGLPASVGLSGGAAAWRGSQPALEAAFAQADRRLLEAKRRGRRRFLAP
jgi:diguanylate cyclase (GGDEF)-like protein